LISQIDLESSVRFVQGVGPARQRMLENINVHSVRDLLYTFPRRYEDRRSLTSLSELEPGKVSSVIARVMEVSERNARNRKMLITTAVITDGAALINAVWFNRRGLEKLLFSGTRVALYGKIDRKYNRLQMVNPEIEVIDEDDSVQDIGRIIPVYPCTSGLNQKWLRNLIRYSLQHFLPQLEEFIPGSLSGKHDLLPLPEAVRSLHYPSDLQNWEKARYRMVFEEFLVLQTGLAIRKKSFLEGNVKAPVCKGNNTYRERFLTELIPFELTEAQKRVIDQIRDDMSRSVPMHRLLQGDVGSGKTVVALLSILNSLDSGYQAALMAPTEVLAQQHYARLSKDLSCLGISCELLSGSTAKRKREDILENIVSGKTKVIIGTHALFQKDVNYSRLGLVIVDEQHRFGVMQRKALKHKGEAPHTLVMTATPIPRTLTLSVYGDLSVSVLDELPPHRQQIETRWVKPRNTARLFSFLKGQIEAGRQIYWVCPVIEESESIDANSLQERYESLLSIFSGHSTEMLHGQMQSGEKEKRMRNFSSGKTDILVSTTVIEVGVDVPNATIIVIEGADRFGLSQLHQLRGRVGRGPFRSYCVLLTEASSEEARKRIKIMCSTNDGFTISEADLKLRGPGEVCGLKQHGVTDFRIADIVKDRKILYTARDDAFDLLDKDPDLLSALPLKEKVIRDLGKTLQLVETG